MGLRDQEEFDGARRSERVAVDAETRLRPNGWSSLQVRMVDLSTDGFRAECDAKVRPGGCVSLDVPGIGAVEAQVEWQRGTQFGARFIAPIDVARCAWDLDKRQSALARLLVERASARRVGRGRAEAQLRREILSALPMHKGCASA